MATSSPSQTSGPSQVERSVDANEPQVATTGRVKLSKAIDWGSFWLGLGGLVVGMIGAIVYGVCGLWFSNDWVNQSNELTLVLLCYEFFCLPILAVFALLTTLPLLMLQRYITRIAFVSVFGFLSVFSVCLAIVTLDDAGDFVKIWDDLSPLLFGYCLAIAFVGSAIGWFTGRTLRPRLKLTIPPRRGSIADALELMAVSALVFVVLRALFESLREPINFWVAAALGLVAGIVVASLTFVLMPSQTDRSTRLTKARYLRVGLVCFAVWLLVSIAVFSWSVWLEPTSFVWRIGWDTVWGRAGTSLVSALVFLSVTLAGVLWLRFVGWSLDSGTNRKLSTSAANAQD